MKIFTNASKSLSSKNVTKISTDSIQQVFPFADNTAPSADGDSSENGIMIFGGMGLMWIKSRKWFSLILKFTFSKRNVL